MRNLLLLLCCCMFLGGGSIDYGDPNNWVMCANEVPRPEQICDVFYIYPTLNASDKVELLDWTDPEMAKKTKDFVYAQAGLFTDRSRVFVPYVRQLEYERCVKTILDGGDFEATKLRQGMLDTQAAFDYYMKHYNQGRPYVLVGHSQGSIDLYTLLKNRRDIAVERGFVGAYLIGLPAAVSANYQKDFEGRQIEPATGAEDLGAFMVWNTQNRNADNKIFTAPHGLCINPLNWRTDSTPATAAENIGEVYYNYKTEKTVKIANFCGAIIDPEKGALIVDLPSNSLYDAHGFIGMGVFHMNDVWFFAENLCANLWERVEKWHKQFVMRNS